MADIDRLRQSFEAWRRNSTRMAPDDAVARDGFGDHASYVNKVTRAMWVGWLACATTEHAAAMHPEGGM